MRKLLISLWFLHACTIAFSSPALSRVPNTTLALPSNPPTLGYSLDEAFPGLAFNEPICMASPPGETNRLFIVERAGRIKVVTNLANPNLTLFLDISSRVNTSVEGGLLGLAFHPGFPTNRQFFVFYTLTTSSSAGTGFHDRLARFESTPGNSNLASSASEVVLINQLDPADNHNGGDLHFGPEGYLYISLGDGGGGYDTYSNSQRIDKDFFSGILRIDVDRRPGSLTPNVHPASSANYAVPADNPFVGATTFNGLPVNPNAVRTEFWAVGLRNPWRMSFDPASGTLFCGDVGQDSREEINVIVKGGNYGWKYREGKIATPTVGSPPPGVTFIEPILDYANGLSGEFVGKSVVGGIVYRGQRISQLIGHYVFGDFMSQNMWALQWDGTNVSNFRKILTTRNQTTYGTDPSNGDLLLVNHFESRISRLVYSSETSGAPLPPSLAQTGAFSDLATLSPNPGIVPYDLNVPFWSDHAIKTRWFSVPNINLRLGFDPAGNWSFPTGTVWIKHFELELTNGVPSSRRRLETRFLVRDSADSVYGITYRWGNSLNNATLVPEGGTNESFLVYDGSNMRTQVWRYPSRGECLTCHTRPGGLGLGFHTAQLNRLFNYPGATENQLQALSAAGYFNSPVPDPATLPVLSHATNTVFSREHRVRSYLAANCVQCHQPGGTGRGLWDARFTTPLNQAGIVNGNLVNDFGDSQNKVIQPGSLQHSILFQRISNFGSSHMPPLATSELNDEAIGLLSAWITSDLQPNTLPVAGSDMIDRYPPSGTKVLVSTLLTNDSDLDGDAIVFVSVQAVSANGGTVTREGDWVYYTAPADFSSDDSFTYTITDNRGPSVTGTVLVKISSSPPRADLMITFLPNGSYHVRGNGVPNLTYRIEYSDELVPSTWHNFGSFVANDVGLFETVDTQGSPQRFYRSIYP